MKKRFSKPTRAESGASLPLALLLFLVCAALSAVVLAAGTAAAGRMAKLQEADQQYYGVTSAAQMFRDALGEQKVVIIQVATETETATVTPSASGSGTARSTETSVVAEPILVDGKDLPGTSAGSAMNTYTLLELAAIDLIGPNATNADEAWKVSIPNVDSVTASTPKSLAISHSVNAPSGVDKDGVQGGLAVNVEQKISADGSLTFTFRNASDTEGKGYTLTLTCVADIDTEEIETETSPTVSVASDGTRTETRTSVKTRTTTISWTASDISKGSVTAGGTS